MATIDLDLSPYSPPPSVKEPGHKTYLGNQSNYVGRFLNGSAVYGLSATTDSVIVPLLVLPGGASIDRWSLSYTAFTTGAVLNLGFRYVNKPAAVANPGYGTLAKGYPTESATQFASSLSIAAANTAGSPYTVQLNPAFFPNVDVEVIATISGTSGTNIIPANMSLVLSMEGRFKGAR